MPNTPGGTAWYPGAAEPFPSAAWWQQMAESIETSLFDMTRFSSGQASGNTALTGTFSTHTLQQWTPPTSWNSYQAMIHADVVLDGLTSGDVVEVLVNAEGSNGPVAIDDQGSANRSLGAVKIQTGVTGVLDYRASARNTTAARGQITTAVYTVTARRTS